MGNEPETSASAHVPLTALPTAPTLAQVAEQLNPAYLLANLRACSFVDERQRLMLRVLQFEAAGGTPEGAELPPDEQPSTPLDRLLMYEMALTQKTAHLFERWIAVELPIRSKRERALLAAEAAFCTALIFEHASEPPAIEVDSKLIGPAQALTYRLVQLAQGQWHALAGVDQRAPTVARLLAAHVAADVLGDPSRRDTLLASIADELPIVAAEWRLEHAWMAGDEAAISAVLRQRYDILTTHGFLAHAQATAMILHLRTTPDLPFPEDIPPAQTPVAWRHLAFLVQGSKLAGDRDRTITLFLDHAAHPARLPAPLALAYRIRAAELLMAQQRWDDALTALPKGKNTDLLIQLADTYRVFCLLRKDKWAHLAGYFFHAAQAEPVAGERALYYILSLLCVIKGGQKNHAVLAQIEVHLDTLDRVEVLEVARVLLATYARLKDTDAVSRVWNYLGKRTDTTTQSLCYFTAAIALLRQEKVDRALSCLKQLSNTDLHNPVAQTAIALVELRQQNWAAALGALEGVAKGLPPAQRGPLLRLLAQFAWALHQPQRAMALLSQGRELGAASLQIDLETAALALELGQAQLAADRLKRAAEKATGEDAANTLRCAAAQIFLERLNRPTDAEALYREVLAVEGSHPGALDGLNRLFSSQQRPRELVRILHKRLEVAGESDELVPVHYQLAVVYRQLWEQEHHPDAASACITHSEQVLARDTAHEGASYLLVGILSEQGNWVRLVSHRDSLLHSLAGLRGLRQAARQLAQWPLLAQVCAALADRAPTPEQRRSAAIEAGQLYQDKLDDQVRAETFLRRAITVDKQSESLAAYAQFLRHHQRAADLVEVLEEQLVLAPTDEARRDLTLELGLLYADELAQPALAQKHLEAVTRLDPRNVEALSALEPLLHAAPQRRVTVLERLLEWETDNDIARDLQLTLIAVYAQLNDQPAQLRLARLLRSRHLAHDDVFAALEALYLRLEQYAELCALYESRIELLQASGDPSAEMATLLQRKAEIQLEQLALPAEAAESYIRMLERRVGDETILNHLEQLLTRLGDWPRLVATYESYANQLTEKRDQMAYLQRAAKIAHYQLKDEAEAARLYEQIYALDPNDPVAFSALERRLERQADYHRLVDLLSDRADRAEGSGEKLDFLLQAAGVCESAQNIERATALYRRAIAISPACLPALEALARIHEALEHWEDLVEITTQQLKLQQDPNRRALLYFKCGSVMETQFRDEDSAYDYYHRAVKCSPACLPALHGLRDLQAKRGEWEAVAKTLAAEVRIWSDPKGKADVLAQLGEIYEGKLGDRPRALECYQRAIKTHPECMRAALALFKVYANEGSINEAAQWGRVYARRGHLRGEASERVQFFVSWGNVLRAVGRPQEAVGALMRALEIDAGNQEALLGLLALCRSHPDVHDYAEAFTRLTATATHRDDHAAHAILSTAMGCLAEHKGNVDEALARYHEALRLDGSRVPLVLPLADLTLLLGAADDAIKLVLDCRGDGQGTHFDEWLSATTWLGDRYLDLGQYERAARCYHEILERQPNLYPLRRQLARAQLMSAQAARAETSLDQVCQQLAAKSPDIQPLAEAYHALGIAAQAANNGRRAEASWRRVSELSPSLVYPYIALARKLHREGDAAGAERELKFAEQSTPERSPDLLRAEAEYYLVQGFRDRAVTLYRKALTTADPQIDDRLNLARALAARGEPVEGVTLVQKIIADDPTSLPAYELLASLWQLQGNAPRAARANQVIRLELADQAEELTAAPVFHPLPPTALRNLSSLVRNSAIEDIWTLVRNEVREHFSPPEPEIALPPPPSAIGAAKPMSEVFGFEFTLSYGDNDQPLVGLFGDTIILAKSLRGLCPADVRALVALALAARKLGYGPLFHLSCEAREVVGRLLGTALLPPARWPAQLRAIVDALPRRDQRQLTRLGESHFEEKDQAPNPFALADAWRDAIDKTVWRVALLATEDLVSIGRAMALLAGIAPSCLPEGGLLLLAEIHDICRYFVSDEFDHARAAITSG